MEGNDGTRTSQRLGTACEEDQERHTPMHQDQSMAGNRQGLKYDQQKPSDLLEDTSQGFLRYLRHQPGYPKDLFLPIPINIERLPLQRPQSPFHRIPAGGLLSRHELFGHAPPLDPGRRNRLLHYCQHNPQIQIYLYFSSYQDDNLRNPGFVNRQN